MQNSHLYISLTLSIYTNSFALEIACLENDFYDNTRIKNKLINYIKEGLVINNIIYSSIYFILKKEIKAIALLSYKPNAVKRKAKLQTTFANL
jgi:hypothetical protein